MSERAWLEIVHKWTGVVRDCAGLWAWLEVLQEWIGVVKECVEVWAGLKILQECEDAAKDSAKSYGRGLRLSRGIAVSVLADAKGMVNVWLEYKHYNSKLNISRLRQPPS